jgi:hypothetical protein
MEARTISQADQSSWQTLAVTTDQHSTGGLSQSDTLTPAHNGSIVCALHGQATVTLRNVVQAYYATGNILQQRSIGLCAQALNANESQ